MEKTTAKIIRKATDINNWNAMAAYYQEEPVVIEKKIVVNEGEFKDFCGRLTSDKPYIAENINLMHKDGHVWHCILITDEVSEISIIVESEGYDYARYSGIVRTGEMLIRQPTRFEFYNKDNVDNILSQLGLRLERNFGEFMLMGEQNGDFKICLSWEYDFEKKTANAKWWIQTSSNKFETLDELDKFYASLSKYRNILISLQNLEFGYTEVER